MKRPLALIGFTYLAVLCLSAQLDIAVCAVFALLCAASAVLLRLGFGPFGRRAALLTVLCTAGAAFAVYAAVWHFAYWPAVSLAGKTAQVQGTVADAPTVSGGYTYYLVKADTIAVGGKTAARGVTLRVKTQESGLSPFTRVTFTAVLSLPSNGASDGFDSRQYFRSKGVYLFASPQGTIETAVASGFHPYALAIRLRQALSARLQDRVGGVWGALSAGILIGDVSNLASWVKNDFTATGISHILAVSGTQTALITQALLWLFARARLPRRLSALATAACVFGFIAVTGFSPSVSRAGVMALLYLGGLLLGREADALNSLGVSVLVLCLFNPFAAMDTGLLLSFSATLGLVLVSGRFVRRVNAWRTRLPARVSRLLGPPAAVFCETAGATLFTLPVILLTFRQISLVTFFSNVIEVPVSLAATLVAAVVALLPGVWVLGWLVTAAALFLRLCCGAMIGYAHLLASLPFASVSTDYGFLYPVLLLVAAAGLLVWQMRGRGADWRAAALCVAFAFSVGLASHAAAAWGVLEFAALPVDNGSCTVLTAGGHAVVVDLSGYDAAYLTARWLKTHNISRVDALILPTWNAKRQSNLEDLSTSVPVRAVYLPGAYRTQVAGGQTVVSVVTLAWRGAVLTLYPSIDGKTVLTTVRYGNARAVLTGGVKADTTAYPLAAQALAAGQLFYGGELSREFIQSVLPQNAIFSGYPTAGAAAGGMLSARGCTVRGVDGQTLLVRTRGGAFVQSN